MATQNDSLSLSIFEILQREAGKDTLLIANALLQENPIISMLPHVKGNEKLGNITATYKSLGKPGRGRFNNGYQKSISEVSQMKDGISWIQDQLDIDTNLAKIMNNRSMQIEQEINAKKERINQDMTNDIIYGTGSLDYMLGVANRLNSSTIRTVKSAGGTAGTASNGGTNLVSFYCFTPGIESFHAFYPEAFPGGFNYTVLGTNVAVTDINSGLIKVRELHNIDWFLGVSMPNVLRNARICNIDVTTLNAYGARLSAGSTISGSGPDLGDLMIDTAAQMQNLSDAKRFWALPRVGIRFLSRQNRKADNMFITETVTEDGQIVRRFDGLRVELCEQLGNAQTSATTGDYINYSEAQVS